MGPHSEIMQTHGFLKTPPKKKKGIKNRLKNPKKDGIKNSLKNPIWKKELKNPIPNPRFQKLKSKEDFDLLLAMAERKRMQDQNLGSKPRSMHDQNP